MNNKPQNLPIIGIDKVYVLSVKSFSDRIEHMREELQKHSIEFEFVFDFDVPDIKEEDLSVFSPSNMEIQHKSLVLKNISVWKKMVKNNFSNILVLEDDAILSDDFRDRLAEILEAKKNLESGHLIFLGGADTKIPEGFFEYPDPLVPRRMTTADGYIIDIDLAKKRLQWLQKNKVVLPADGLMCKIDEDLEVLHYWPKKAIVQQASCTGKFRTTLDGSRSKHSLFYLTLRYKWHKLKNQTVKRYLRRIAGK